MAGLIGISACHAPNQELSGRYVCRLASAYSIADDTLLITALNLTRHTYQIEDRTVFQRIRPGRKFPPEFHRESWQATWEDTAQALIAADGRRLSPDEHRKGLWLHSIFYRRLP